QLPPVPNRVGDKIITPIFAFDSKTWESCIGHPVILTQVFRQKDQGFVELLNAMRFGKIENVGAFTALAREVKYTDGIEPTELLSTRAEVDTSNNSRLAKLEGDCQTYQAMQYAGIFLFIFFGAFKVAKSINLQCRHKLERGAGRP
ncbi:hypothetical protein C8R43DRAFT_907325, partial [Mycena crocata]